MARALQMSTVIVPPAPGLFSAVGLLLADIEHHFVRTLFRRTGDLACDEINAAYMGLEANARSALAREGHTEGVVIRRFADLRYSGQAYELTVPVADGQLGWDQIAAVVDAFGEEHLRTYGHQSAGEPVDLVNVRVVGGVPAAGNGKYDIEAALAINAGKCSPGQASRMAYFGTQLGLLDTPVIGRSDLHGSSRLGPLIVEEYDATCVVPPGCEASLDAYGNIAIAVR
jgi:N-methylhydantoinase A